MSIFPIIRLAAFSVVSFFSLVDLALAAHFTSVTQKYLKGYYAFAALAIAVSFLTMVCLIGMIVIDQTRKGAVTSMIAVELGVTGVLWVLWVATAGSATDANLVFFTGTCDYRLKDMNAACHEYPALQAFGYLNWFILIAYFGLLLVLTIIAATRGHHLWTSAVKNVDFFAPAVAKPQPQQQQQVIVPQTTGVAYQQAATIPQGQFSTTTPQYPPNHSMAPGFAGTPIQQAQSPYPQV